MTRLFDDDEDAAKRGITRVHTHIGDDVTGPQPPVATTVVGGSVPCIHGYYGGIGDGCPQCGGTVLDPSFGPMTGPILGTVVFGPGTGTDPTPGTTIFGPGPWMPQVDTVVDDTNPKDRLGAKKPPLTLVPPALVIYTSRVMALGAAKYGPYNWREKKVKLSVYIEAAMRHLMALFDGEDTDPESGMPHSAHAAACMGIILDALATGNLIDDRPIKGAAARLLAELTNK